MIGCELVRRRRPLGGAPALVAPRPHRQVDARRRGRPHRGLRPHPVGPAHPAFGPRPDAAQQGRRRVANALAAAGFVETPSFGFTTEEQNDLHGSASGDTSRRSSSRTRSTASRRSCAARWSGPPAGRPPQRLARIHRPRAVRDRRRLPARAGRRVRHVVRPAAGRATGCRDPRRARRLDPAAAPPRRGAAGGQRRRQAARSGGRRGRPLRRPRRRARHRRRGGRRRSTSPRASAPRCTRAAPACCPSAGVEVGYVGELLPAVAEASDLHGRVYRRRTGSRSRALARGQKVVAESLSGFPAATQDVSLVLDADVPAAAVRAALVEGAGELLESLRLVDDYRGRSAGGLEEPDLRAALPRPRPHAHGGRGDRGEARGRRRGGRALRRDPARVAPR